ncbi:mediator of RNA polymerase II transcription subunit 29 [Bombyx mori]|uniref:Mediator of RNA polymerase II transcription subunit 29 n=1 Tax=Bombyx mori TaxID=7091 RepID=MED29_BOMMO|nr:mediator of RNA polymerase II transcription subunit 29 [Bombyx mori]Q5ISW3.1 RecName: Full=Mediator of RNA polymerase II transcription subunit 29; AltName: Full=Mediator complex subunit 29; AltName: Full=Protein intersex [Bombyx mori]AAV65896.1 intersex [Bombyx mori]
MNHNQMNMHVPMNQVAGAPNVAMQMPVPGPIMQQQSPQQMQPAPVPQQTQQDKMDNISKVKSLMGSLRESIPMTLKSAAQILHQNHNADSNTQKGMDNPVPRFEKNLEEFFSICDQMELHLRTATTCIQQAQSAAHYLPLSVIASRLDSGPTTQETTLSYPQYLKTVGLQISYAKDIHDTLVAAAQNISPPE